MKGKRSKGAKHVEKAKCNNQATVEDEWEDAAWDATFQRTDLIPKHCSMIHLEPGKKRVFTVSTGEGMIQITLRMGSKGISIDGAYLKDFQSLYYP